MYQNEIQMLRSLISSMDYMETFQEPPEVIAPQFASWINAVSLALNVIGLDQSYEAWQEHLKTVQFIEDESSLPIQMASLKAIVIGFVGKLKRLSPKTDDSGSVAFVDPKRIEEICSLNSNQFDFSKLVEMCREINNCYATESFLAVAMLTRAIVDHVSPIFGYRSFGEVANNYAWRKSDKDLITQLETQSRKIADLHLHGQIRSSETLPVRTQINFQPNLDILLAEIIRIFK